MSKSKWAAVVVLAMYLLEEKDEDDGEHRIEEKPKRRKRSVWTKNWLMKRDTDGYCVKLMKELSAEEPNLYFRFVPMTVEQYDNLLALVGPYIQKNDTTMRMSISPSDRLALTLRYLATGENFVSLQNTFHIPQSTISRIIPEVLDTIYRVLAHDYFKLPKSKYEWKVVAQQFNTHWHFPNCIGAVAGKHVAMIAPANSGGVFYNYKGSHSIVLMGIADAEYKLLYIDVGSNERQSVDGDVFKRCSFSVALETDQLCLPPPQALPGRKMRVPYVLVADDAFTLRNNIMKPYDQFGLSTKQRVFNYRLSHTRHTIENIFGILSTRFRVLRKPIYLNAEKTKKVVLAICALHNYFMSTDKTKYAPSTAFDQYDAEGNLVSPGDWRSEGEIEKSWFPLQNQISGIDDDAQKIRKEFANSFDVAL